MEIKIFVPYPDFGPLVRFINGVLEPKLSVKRVFIGVGLAVIVTLIVFSVYVVMDMKKQGFI